MNGFVNPTYKDPSQQTLETLLAEFKRDIYKNINCAKVGVITSFDAAKQEAGVRIAFQQVTSIAPDGTKTIAEYPLLANVPVLFPGGGGYTLTFPVTAGDECLVVFNDRYLGEWLTSGPGLPPSIGLLHDLGDGIAFVGLRSNPRALSGVSTSTTQLRSDDGETFVEIDGSGKVVTVKAEEKVIMDTKILEVRGIVNVLNENSETVPCNVNGDIVTNGDVMAGTISLKHHIHSGVQTGGSNTGQPV